MVKGQTLYENYKVELSFVCDLFKHNISVLHTVLAWITINSDNAVHQTKVDLY